MTSNMKKYEVVIKPNLKELVDTVNEAVEQGYYPKGGILHTEGNFIQTIFLRGQDLCIPRLTKEEVEYGELFNYYTKYPAVEKFIRSKEGEVFLLDINSIKNERERMDTVITKFKKLVENGK